MFRMIIISIFLNIIYNVKSEHFYHRVNHMEFYKNRTRPSKAFTSFSTNYFTQNLIPANGNEKIQCGTRTVDFNPRRMAKIVGGSESPYGAFPWQVDIQMLDQDKFIFEHHCGGAVVAERLVLSAAHCFDKQPLLVEHFRVVTGKHKLSGKDQHENRFQAEKIIKHHEFRKTPMDSRYGPHSNDIALISVKSRNSRGIQFNSHVRPICLPDSRVDAAGNWCTVSGWGYEEESTENFSPVLRAASVPVVDLSICRKNQVLGGRQQAILDTMICAGVLGGGVDACRGDSGGPLACTSSAQRWQLAGIVSWGAGCARRARPGVYTRVASYIPWIKTTAAILGHRI